MTHASTSFRSSMARRIVAALMVLVLLMPLITALPAVGGPLPVQPQLLQAAEAKPDATVSVIIQKVQGATGVEEKLTRLGGSITHDLYFINAIAAEMPGRAVAALARDSGVRWLSLNAPVIDASEPVQAVGDTQQDGMEGAAGDSAAESVIYIPITVGTAIEANSSGSFQGMYPDIPDSGQTENKEQDPSQDSKEPETDGSTDTTTEETKDTTTEGSKEATTDGSTEGSGDSAADPSTEPTAVPEDTSAPAPTPTSTPVPEDGTDGVEPSDEEPSDEELSDEELSEEELSEEAGARYYGNDYTAAIRADELQAKYPDLLGQDITVAVVDSGINDHPDLRYMTDPKKNKDYSKESRVVARRKFNSKTDDAVDRYGHGTHVAGIIGGNGVKSEYEHVGVAPRVRFVNIKVSDDKGAGTTADVVAGLQWIYENHDLWNIRVVNVSLNSGVAESYHTSPINAALEILWFNGIVVVVSGGNNGETDNGVLYPPSNDPFVISVGATDAEGEVAEYSAYGTTESGFSKPDLVAPGSHIISLLASYHAVLAKQHPDHITKDTDYFRISGTSMAAAVTSGAAALLLQAEPHLTPDQVKYRLMSTARPMDHPGAGAGQLDIFAAVQDDSTETANTGIEASQLLGTGDGTLQWDSLNWNSVNWNSVNWNSVNWNSVNWNSVNWN